MLSDYEREQLALIERHLAADPSFLSADRPDASHRVKARVMMVTAGILGMGVVVAGVAANSAVVGVLGFSIMLGGAVIGLRHPEPPTLIEGPDRS